MKNPQTVKKDVLILVWILVTFGVHLDVVSVVPKNVDLIAQEHAKEVVQLTVVGCVEDVMAHVKTVALVLAEIAVKLVKWAV